jgi:hypothetical protein
VYIFSLQGSCKKKNDCNFSHEEISENDILEYNDTFINCVLPAKFLVFSKSYVGFEIDAHLLSPSGHIVSAYPYKFRKKKNQALPI